VIARVYVSGLDKKETVKTKKGKFEETISLKSANRYDQTQKMEKKV